MTDRELAQYRQEIGWWLLPNNHQVDRCNAAEKVEQKPPPVVPKPE